MHFYSLEEISLALTVWQCCQRRYFQTELSHFIIYFFQIRHVITLSLTILFGQVQRSWSTDKIALPYQASRNFLHKLTWIDWGDLFSIQWAAVKMWVESIIVPPHHGQLLPVLTKAACQGIECLTTSSPPTIRIPTTSLLPQSASDWAKLPKEL